MNPPHTPYAVRVRPAASVLILRERAARLEVFVQHRATTMDFAAGAVVFPGGRVDEIDRAIAQASNYPQQVLRDHTARWAHTSLADTEESTAHRRAATVLAAALREVTEETGAVLRPEQFRPWANWITPDGYGYARRFDTFFYTVVLDPDQQPDHLTTEATHSEWLRPETILHAHTQGQLTVLLPTRTHLSTLHRIGTLEDLERELEAGADEPLRPITPRIA